RTNMLLEMTANFTVNPTVLPLIVESQRLSQQSQGLFNPAIGHLIRAWGFQSDMGPEDETPPAAEDLQELLARNPQMSDIVVDNVRMRSTNPAVRLDMGAIAKGYALDQIIEHLQDQGIAHVMINAGGDLKAIGQHPEGRPWYIGIKHPRQQDEVLAGLAVMSGESVFTSGDYERFFMHEGKRYHHIIDPRSGYPADQAQSVTVITRSATLADAASTALFIAGPEQWPAIARAMGIEYVLFVDADGHAEATPAMLERLQQVHPALQIQPRPLP
ncbi:MAG: FAD:protein FMN transferase, partial [Gammaproteobacteria bacterium]